MAKAICAIPECERPVLARGWCSLHYDRWRHHGSALWEPYRHSGTCAVEECNRPVERRRWCNTHYRRWLRYGDPTALRKVWKHPPDRWCDLVDPQSDGCWYWRGPVSSKGYGQLHIDSRTHYAHRYVWEQLIGPVPMGLELDHLCRVRHCVNPMHLEPVTHEENVRRAQRWREEA